MPRLSARQPSLGLRDDSEDNRPLDGLVYDGADPTAEHRAHVRELNAARQQAEARLSSPAHRRFVPTTDSLARHPFHVPLRLEGRAAHVHSPEGYLACAECQARATDARLALVRDQEQGKES